MLWACASLSFMPDRDWLSLFYDAFDVKVRSFNPQDISNMLWALARLEALDRGISSGPLSSPPTSGGKASSIMPDPPSSEREEAFASPDPSSSAPSSSRVEEGIIASNVIKGRGGPRAFRAPPTIISKLVNRAQHQLPNFSTQQLSNSIWALAKMDLVPKRAWVEQFAEASTRKLRSGDFSSQELASLAMSVSHLQWNMGPDWNEAVLRASYALLPRMPPEHLSQVRIHLLSGGGLFHLITHASSII